MADKSKRGREPGGTPLAQRGRFTTGGGPGVPSASNNLAGAFDSAQTLTVGIMQQMLNQQKDDMMKQLNLQMRSNMKDIRKEVHEAKTIAEETASTAKSAQEAVQSIKEQLSQGSYQNKGRDDTGKNISDEDRDKQIIIHGFKKDTEEEEIITTISDIIKKQNFENKVEKIFTFTDTASMGVIQFCTVKGKRGFFKKMRDVEIAAPNGKTFAWTNNETTAERIRLKRLGYIKHLLHEHVKIPMNDIKIDRNKSLVKIKSKIVAKPKEGDDDDTLELLCEALQIQEALSASMATFMAKLHLDD